MTCESSVPDAYILLARGGYSGKAAEEQTAQIVARMAGALNNSYVAAAFVDQGEPALPTALEHAAQAGARCILVQPIYFPDDINLHRWLMKVIKRWHVQWSGPTVHVLMGAPLGQQPLYADALAAHLAAVPADVANVTAEPPAHWEKDPDGWSHVPAFRCHVLLCRGPRCTAAGADQVVQRLRTQLKSHHLVQDDRVLTVQTGCLYPCNWGPLMVVYPDGIWYGDLSDDAIDQIVERHFVGGAVVDDYVVKRANND